MPPAQSTDWPDVESSRKKINDKEELHSAIKEASASYLKFISYVLTICMSVIIGGGGFFVTKAWGKIDSIDSSLAEINKRSAKNTRRMAFIEEVNRKLAVKNGVDIEMLEKIRDLQDRETEVSRVN